ncbi:prohead core scaffold protein [Aeromonas phage ZPAH1]|nr:prohead core scaffold protein [Aeromonas phage Aswh_1]QQG34029.1 prohead core scaffold protein [Aeromonas phage ZPAH1]
MSIKDQLLSEAKNITIESDALSKALEGVQLNESVKETLTDVFQAKVRSEAVRLAESHIEALAARSDELVEEAARQKNEELMQTLDGYFEHLTEQFMEDNKVAIQSGIKSQMTESLLATLKEAFVAHNVHVPEESIDVVAEMESELSEAHEKINTLLTKNTSLTESLQSKERESILSESIKDLTVIQQEQVMTLSEGITFGDADAFKSRIGSLVEMVSQKVETKATNLNEQEDKDKLNFKKDDTEDEGEGKDKDDKGKDKDEDKKSKSTKIDESIKQYVYW